jgi:hypothetical protein
MPFKQRAGALDQRYARVTGTIIRDANENGEYFCSGACRDVAILIDESKDVELIPDKKIWQWMKAKQYAD